MALVEYTGGNTPLRGKVLGTVFQTGRYGAVIKSKHSSQGQRLRRNLDAQEALSHSSTLFDQLTPYQKSRWRLFIPDFPTEDRDGNPVLSSARDLFMRTVARLPISLQTALPEPRSVYIGAPIDPATVSVVNDRLRLKLPPVPAGEAFSISLIMSPPVSVGRTTAAPKMVRIFFANEFFAPSDVDITNAYEAVYGAIPMNAHILYCATIYKTSTPQILSEYCSYLSTTTAFIFIADEISGFQLSGGRIQVKSAYTSKAAIVDSVNNYFTDNLFDPSGIAPNTLGLMYDQISDKPFQNNNYIFQDSPTTFAAGTFHWPDKYKYPAHTNDPFTAVMLVNFKQLHGTGSFSFLMLGQPVRDQIGFRFYFTADGTLQFILRGYPQVNKQFVSLISDDDLHMLAVTYDGSLNISGVNIYLDDMSTPLTPTNINGSKITASSIPIYRDFPFYYHDSPMVSVLSELHIINKVLDQAELDLFKAFFKQAPAYQNIP